MRKKKISLEPPDGLDKIFPSMQLDNIVAILDEGRINEDNTLCKLYLKNLHCVNILVDWI